MVQTMFIAQKKYTSDKNGNTKILSFQSKEVINLLLEKGEYKADLTKLRENNDYTRDIKMLQRNIPIWGFVIEEEWNERDWYRGTYFSLFRREMSILEEDFLNLVCLELDIPQELVKTGLTRNFYPYACVFPVIRHEYINAVYTVEHKPLDEKKPKRDYRVIVQKTYQKSNGSSTIFETGFQTLTVQECDDLDLSYQTKAVYPLTSRL